jgi:vacuolar-type H+-ATPase subunit H
MSIPNEEIFNEIGSLRSSDMASVRQAFQNLQRKLHDATPQEKEEIEKALAWASSTYGGDLRSSNDDKK